MSGAAYGFGVGSALSKDGTPVPPQFTLEDVKAALRTAKNIYDAVSQLTFQFGLAYSEAQMYIRQFGIGPHLRGSVGRKGDKPGKRARVDGDHVLINTLRSTPTRVSLGPSISFNNTSFLQEMLNRKTSVTVCGGYHFYAKEGKRAFHLQHFRHSAFAANPPDITAYYALSTGSTADTISLIQPVSEASDYGPDRTTAYKTVSSDSGILGGGNEFAPWSLTDLENISYNLQDAKHFLVSPNISIPQVSEGAQASNIERGAWSYNPIMMARNKFACRSLIYQQNQIVNSNQDFETGNQVNDNAVKCKPVLQGGTVSYSFMNTGTSPAAITCVVYKVKPTYKSPTDHDGGWKSNYLSAALLEDIRISYLNKGNGIRLKNMMGRKPVGEDATLDANFQFLPKHRSAVPASNPFTEQHRYTCVVAAGQEKNVTISLPGRMYNPTSVHPCAPAALQQDGVEVENATTMNHAAGNWPGTVNPPFWSGEQYSVAVGVSGCRAVMKFSDKAGTSTSDVAEPSGEDVTTSAVCYDYDDCGGTAPTWDGGAPDATVIGNPEFTANPPSSASTPTSLQEGMTTTSASVTCRVKYTERVGAMNMQYISKPTVGRANFEGPTPGVTSDMTTVALVPQAAITRPTGSDGIINL